MKKWMRRIIEEEEEKWKKKREEMRRRIEELEERLLEVALEKGDREGTETNQMMEVRVREMEKKIERKEREEKKRNIVIKGIRGGENVENNTREVLKDLRIDEAVEEIKYMREKRRRKRVGGS